MPIRTPHKWGAVFHVPGAGESVGSRVVRWSGGQSSDRLPFFCPLIFHLRPSVGRFGGVGDPRRAGEPRTTNEEPQKKHLSAVSLLWAPENG